MSKKTYTISINGAVIPSFMNMLKSRAEGAMSMAEAFFTKNHHFIMKCDQTGEVIDEVKPREVYLN
ncbi:hypothetical protein LCGC14_1676880 [marine sediment metagenome]|uniref:Uncharacterized protein n=1 Tax=marine sediment metagenome TaxID=412755 RepID=A0A0F9IC59_9ZZZZ